MYLFIECSKTKLTIPNMKQLYYSLIHPHLTYGVTLWGSAFKYELNKIIKAQKKAIINICKAQYNEHTTNTQTNRLVQNSS